MTQDDLQRMFEQAFQINEMATIGICYGQRVVTNSLDHGKPHIHYGKVKVYLPEEMPKNATELEKDVEKLSGKVVRLAARADVDLPVEEHLIVELYSK